MLESDMEVHIEERNSKVCFYCSKSSEDMTTHHEPPKNLFPRPLPPVMLTVPCCSECHDIFLKDDEYLRRVLLSCDTIAYDPNAQIVREKLFKSMRRPQAAGMKNAIGKSLRYVDVNSPGGIYLGKKPAMEVDVKRLNRIIDRIARGLFFIIHEYPVPINHEITCRFKDSYLGMPEKFIYKWKGLWEPPVTFGNNIFSYSYILCEDDPNGMLFVYWFYDKLWFFGFIAPKPDA